MHPNETTLAVPPDDYVTAGLLNVVGGTMNAGTAAFVVLLYIGCCGLGAIFLIPMMLGIWQAAIGYQMAMGRKVMDGQSVSIAGLIAGMLGLNMWGAAASLVALLMYQRNETRLWLAEDTG